MTDRSLASGSVPPDGADDGAQLGDDRQAVLEWSWWRDSHPRTLEAGKVLSDDVVARGVVDQLEYAGGVAFVLVARPALILGAHTHRVPALEED